MKLIIFSSLSFWKVFSTQSKTNCNIHYLEPNNNLYLKYYVRLVEKIYNHKFYKVKMGKIKDNNNDLLINQATKKTSEDIQQERIRIYERSPNNILKHFGI